MTTHPNSFKARRTMTVGGKKYVYFSLAAAEKNGLKGISRLPYSLKVLLENLLRNEDGTTVTAARHQGRGRLAEEEALRPRDRLPARARADAGPDRRAGGGRSGRDARCDGQAGRRSGEDQSAGRSRSRHRPFGDGRQFRPQGFLQEECDDRIRAQWRTLCVPALGPAGVREFQRRAAGHRHLPSGQSGISGADGVDAQSQERARPRRSKRSPSPTRWSAPTATPPWSTACRCWAGAWAASKPKRPCWASRSRC